MCYEGHTGNGREGEHPPLESILAFVPQANLTKTIVHKTSVFAMLRAAVIALLPGAALGLASPPPRPSTASQASASIGRRGALLSGMSLFAIGSSPASASYAMSQAAVEAHSWEATGKAKERAVYQGIKEDIQEKRGRTDVGTLGYVGGDYTKRSAGDRYEFEMARQVQQGGGGGGSGYTKPEEILEEMGLSTFSAAGARRLVSP